MKNEQPNKKAIALRYDPENGNTPMITAVGKGAAAESIMKSARENQVPIYEDSFQANTLAGFDVGSRIPKFLYDLVAEIMVFVEEADMRKQKGNTPGGRL